MCINEILIISTCSERNQSITRNFYLVEIKIRCSRIMLTNCLASKFIKLVGFGIQKFFMYYICCLYHNIFISR